MIYPGGARGAVTSGLLATLAADPTPASYIPGGVGVDAGGRILIATGAVNAADTYVNGFRIALNGAIRGSVSGSAGVNYLHGYWFTDDGRLRISDGISNADNVSAHNGDAFVASGRLCLDY